MIVRAVQVDQLVADHSSEQRASSGEPLTNCRLLPPNEKLRLRMNSPAHGSMPGFLRGTPFSYSRNQSPAKIASTVQASAPVRMSDLSARSPNNNLSAPMMIDLPAPVSPVMATKPGAELPLQVLDQREILDAEKAERSAVESVG